MQRTAIGIVIGAGGNGVYTCSLGQARGLPGIGQGRALLLAIFGAIKLYPQGKVATNPGSDRCNHLQQKTRTIFKAATILVRTHIGEWR